jgi:folate-binding protein YgfZ
MTEIVAYRLPRDVLSVTGADTVDYLQGQLSQDVAALGVGDSAWSFALQPQGKVDGWFRLTRRREAEFVLDTDPGAGAGLVARLERFKLRVAVDVTPLDWSMVALRASSVADLDGLDVAGAEIEAQVAFGPMVGVDLLGPDVTVPEGVPEGTPDDYDRLRIGAGVPVVGAELTADTIPAEAGVVARSVSFTKGCFTGQELVARIDSRGGNVPRHLRGVVVEGEDAPTVGADIRVDGDVVGSLTSVAPATGDSPSIGLCYVKRAVAVPTDVELAWDGGTVVGEVRELPLDLGS